MNAIKVKDYIILNFTTVLDELTLGLVEEDEDIREVVDRAYWENRGTKTTLGMADRVLELIRGFAPQFEPKYNKFYIGLAENGRPNNFASFRPQKNHLRLEIRLKQTEEVGTEMEESGLEVINYDKRHGTYRLRLAGKEIEKQEEILRKLLVSAFEESRG